YSRDGRGGLLTDKVYPVRIRERFAPISMVDYYGFIARKAVGFLGGETGYLERRLELFVSEGAQGRVDEWLDRQSLIQDKPKVILVPGGSFGASKWWGAERYAKLADRLIEDENCDVILSCAPDDAEKELARKIVGMASHRPVNLAEEGSVDDLKELIGRCQLMVSNDTGPCHIAAAFDVPLVTIFGATDPRWTATGYQKEVRLRAEVECGPCQEPICGEGHHRCMEEISVDDVYEAARQLLGSSETVKCYIRSEEDIAGTNYSCYAEPFVPSDDGDGLVHGWYKRFLGSLQLRDMDSVFAFDGGERLEKPGLGVRERIRFELPLAGDQKVVMYLKRYGYPGMVALFRRWLSRRSRAGAAVYDFDAAMRLAEKGIAVPRPVAFGEQKNWLGEQRSFVMMEELPQADALERLLPKWAEKQKGYMLLRDKKELIRQVAELVRQLHRAEYYHRDLYLSHIFLSRDKFGGERLNLIDLQRVFRPLIRRRRWQVKDLAQLFYSARDYFSGADIMRFLHAYLECKRLSAGDKRLVRAIYNKAKRIEWHNRR
ncbi:MAG: phosphotransferase, partial [Planctomycetes bacterium]|nr:phosphotransferase [Planctomycetota bacterium]